MLLYIVATYDVRFMSVFGQVQQKSAEVMGALRVFRDGVQSVRNQITCQTSLLGTLEHHITNYITIVNFVYEQVRQAYE